MGLGRRVGRVAKALAGRPRADQFGVIEAVPVGRPAAEGLPVGLHRTGPPGSTAGLLVYDPAAGGPVVPEGRLAPWGLLIVCEGAAIDPPADDVVPR